MYCLYLGHFSCLFLFLYVLALAALFEEDTAGSHLKRSLEKCVIAEKGHF